MICLLVMNPSLVFFERGSFIDYLMKLLLIAGGGISLKQARALIGNLISNGAGSNEMRDAAVAGGLGGMLGKIPGAGLVSGSLGAMKQEITGKVAQKVLPSWAQRSYANGGKGGKDGKADKGSDSQNSSIAVSAGKSVAKQAITGGGNDQKENSGGNDKKPSDNTNDKKPEGNGQGNNIVNSARFCSHPLEGVSHQPGTSPSAGKRFSRNNRKYRKKKKRVYPLTPGAIDYPRQDHKKYE
jgi:hypothetical protein